ncbi:retrovirus-related pol polyprotein from transposon TNT 1-94 [Tanacetum coccineum]
MATIAENVIAAGSETHPPMLKKGILDMILMSMTPMQINMKFVNHLQPEWSRFVTTAKQARDLHSVTLESVTYNPPPSYSSPQTQYQAQPTKVYQPYQHYQSSTPITQQLIQSPPLQSYAPTTVQQPPTYQPDTELAIPTFILSNAINNQASGAQVINIVRYAGPNQPRVVSCYNCNGEGHIAKQCTARKKVKDSEYLEETDDCEDLQLQATSNFKVGQVDAYDLDCDDEATANAIFMENLSPVGYLNDDTVEPCYDSDILSEVPHYDTYHNSDMLNSNIQELGYIENIVSNNESYDELTSNSNAISYTDYMLTIGNDEDNYVPPPIQRNDIMLSFFR